MKIEGCSASISVSHEEFAYEKQGSEVSRPSWSVAVFCLEFGGVVCFKVTENPENGELSIVCDSGVCENKTEKQIR